MPHRIFANRGGRKHMDDNNMDILMQLCKDRYQNEKGIVLNTADETSCYYSILGILEREGFVRAHKYIETAKLLDF